MAKEISQIVAYKMDKKKFFVGKNPRREAGKIVMDESIKFILTDLSGDYKKNIAEIYLDTPKKEKVTRQYDLMDFLSSEKIIIDLKKY